ncbi:unnamed protein product, partial [marine sediment metagenome]
ECWNNAPEGMREIQEIRNDYVVTPRRGEK